MQPKTIFWRIVLIGSFLLLAACSPAETPAPTMDEALIFTQVAQTVAAQFTQTAAAQPSPTFTLVPPPTLAAPGDVTATITQPPIILPLLTATATVSLLTPQATPTGPLCNDSIFIRQVGVQDGAILKPGQKFETGWVMQNTGICTWGAGYTLVRVSGNTDFDAPPFAIRDPKDFVQPGALFEISLHMTAPKTPGIYEAYYQMYSDKSIPFGMGMFLHIEVRK